MGDDLLPVLAVAHHAIHPPSQLWGCSYPVPATHYVIDAERSPLLIVGCRSESALGATRPTLHIQNNTNFAAHPTAYLSVSPVCQGPPPPPVQSPAAPSCSQAPSAAHTASPSAAHRTAAGGTAAAPEAAAAACPCSRRTPAALQGSRGLGPCTQQWAPACKARQGQADGQKGH